MSGDYLSILLESAWKASIVPLSQEPTFFAMQAFGGYDMGRAFALAVTGATLGQVFNWLLGTLLLTFKKCGVFTVPEEGYAKTVMLFNQYGVFLLLFCWGPLCNFLVVLAGFVGAKPKIVLPLVILGEAINYGRHLL